MTFWAWLGSVFGDKSQVESEFELLLVANFSVKHLITFADSFDSDQCKKDGKDQESIQSSTTPGTRYKWESDNVIIRHDEREPRGQLFPSR